ncbi:MAG: TonB-dependent receptor domain-containing protein [Bacteroidota bacterium]
MRVLWIAFFLLTSSGLFAQGTGTIKGAVTEDGKPVAFATVFITSQLDSAKVLSGGVSDEAGHFAWQNIPYGEYMLRVKMLGFITKRIPVELSAASPVAEIQPISLEPDVRMLNAVEVLAARELIQKTDEGFVVNAASNLTQIGGTAADLLKNMPGVWVGADGEVTLRGKTPLTLINGRVSGIVGIDRGAQLQQIPAGSIERIEIISNPSAKYDADSEGGIINIVLKKNEDAGTNGAFAVGLGKGERYRLNASALINYKKDKWNIGAAYDNWYTTRTRRVKGDRINDDVPEMYYLTQRRFDERLVFYQNAKTNIDFIPDNKNAVSFEALWAFPGEDNRESLKNIYETDGHDFTGSNQRHSNEIRRSNSVEASLKYVHRFDTPGKLLTANVSNAFNKDKEDTDITTSDLSEEGGILRTSSVQRTHVYQQTNLFNLSLDYDQPMSNQGMFETGYKGITRYLNSDYGRAVLGNGSYISDPLNTGIFDFNEQIHAAYLQFSGWQGLQDEPRWKYDAGLRAEQVWNNGETINKSTSFANQYFNLFPSGTISFYSKKQNNLKLGYGRRISRPGLGQLNPFTDITDSLNQRSGNPKLKPELIHSWELSYNHTIKKGSVSVSAFYRVRNNAILPFTVLDESGVAFTQPRNFGKAITYGSELIATYNPFSFYDLNASLSAFRVSMEDVNGTTGVSNDLLSWYAKLVNNFTMTKKGKLQVIGNYTAPTAIPQGESVAVYFVDAGYQHKIMKGKGRLGAVVTDIFNTQESGLITSDSGFVFSRIFKQDTRAVMITFGYSFRSSLKESLMENRFRND